MILYEKKIEKSGIDCWRSFEYSWLDMKGRPQTGCLEVTIENSSLAINSFELKKKLSLMHQHSFEDAQHALTFIQEILNNQGALVTLKQIEHDINPVHPLSSYTGHYYIRRTVRFLCALTKQPFCGELHIIFANPVSDPEHLDWLLLNSRSKEFMQADYIDDLKNKIATVHQGYALSLHLARRGGISYQAIRWSQYPFLEPKNLLTISIME